MRVHSFFDCYISRSIARRVGVQCSLKNSASVSTLSIPVSLLNTKKKQKNVVRTTHLTKTGKNQSLPG